MRTRKYMHGKRRRVAPLRQNEEKKLPSGSGITGTEIPKIKKFLRKPPNVFSRGYTDKQIAEYLEHTRKIKQRGGYHADEFQKGHKQKDKAFEKKQTKTKTKSRDLKIPLGGVAGMMLIPKSAGEGSSVIDPKTGINKYTGKREYNPF